MPQVFTNNGKFCSQQSATKSINTSGRLVTPGFVDCHTHLVWAGSRANEYIRRCAGEDYLTIAKSGGGILSTMRATREASVEQLAQGIITRAQTMLECGTTHIEIKASYGLSAEGCKKELDAIQLARPNIKQRIAVTFMGAHAVPPELSREAYLIQLEKELIPMAAEHPADVKFCDVFCEETAFTLEESRRVLEAGFNHGLTPKIHSDEFNALGGTEMACELGAASADHLLVSGPNQFEALANSKTVAVTMPSTAFFLNKPYANARAMIDAGCIVALGTDFNPGTSVAPSMLFAIGLAVSKMRLTPSEALTAATENAAKAIGSNAGSFTDGEPADFCLWPCESLDELVYQYLYIKPDEVYIAGERVV